MGVSKKEAASFLSVCSDDKRFWCNDSITFGSLEELEKGLKSMDKATFSHHLNKEKNDFSSWIYNVVGDIELAASLRKVKSITRMKTAVKKRITALKKAAK